MEISSVIALLVGLASTFSGIIFAMMGSANKQIHVKQETQLADHEGRLQHLEKRDAVRDAQFETVLERLDEVSILLREHVRDAHKRAQQEDDGR